MNFYVDISIVGTFGTGTELDPFSYDAFITHLQAIPGSANYTYHIKGYTRIAGNPEALDIMIPIAGSTPAGGYTVTFRGWDIETYGPPIFERYTTSGGNVERPIWGDNGYNPVADISDIDFTFEDIAFIDNTADRVDEYYRNALSIPPAVYKDCFFSAHEIRTDIVYTKDANTHASGKDTSFYGCTFQWGTNFRIGNPTYKPGIFTSYDCTFVGDANDYYSQSPIIFADKVVFENNTSVWTGNEFTAGITTGDSSEYTPPIQNTSIEAVPTYPGSTASLLATFTNPNIMYFANYGLPVSDNPTLDGYRNTYDYNNGLFDKKRTSFGAYSFVLDIETEDFPTSGHIGAFYFGGEYDNATVSTNVSLNITPSDSVVSVSTYVSVDNSSITLHIPDEKVGGFAKGNQNFFIDFVGKERKDDTYPKFYRCGDDRATTDNEIKDYKEQITGGNPVVVDFVACANAAYEYEGYEPVEYKWWFDYEGEPDNYVTCAGPSATHNYCGGYLEDYDVRLCVEFEAPIKGNN